MGKASCGFAKINFDAIVSNDKVGYGVIVRDSDSFKLRGSGGFKENIIDQDRIIPSDVSQVNFGCMRQLTNVYLGFNVMNPSSVEWKEFQKKWKESDNLFFPSKSKPTTLAPIEKANDEEEKDVKESVDPPTRENA
ncbi:hypothetical protein Gogos_000023 [Gossypium gossypioides]|uniref:Uncharacterized protein n=1 Tax=Gossypium gossypioides TaxID=34282 RepID=A0A7J9D754_GOSGO|nr:hypothetical protein [Gossypium gossypioides]